MTVAEVMTEPDVSYWVLQIVFDHGSRLYGHRCQQISEEFVCAVVISIRGCTVDHSMC
jgi:hypothetical protein